MGTRRVVLQMVGYLAAVVVHLWAGTALPATINVPADYASIQAAIDAATDGDEAVVAPDTYYENISFRGKPITVRSTDPADPAVVAATVIDGQQNGSVVTFNSSEGPESVLRGLTVTGGKAEYGGGVYCKYASPTVMGNTIIGNAAGRHGGGGIYCGGSSTISGNTIAHNTAGPGAGGGIQCYGSPTISNNVISGNVAGSNSGGGIHCGDCFWGSSPTISNNTISHNRAGERGGAIRCERSSVTIVNCLITFSARGGGISASGGHLHVSYSNVYGHAEANYVGFTPSGPGNISVDPLFADATNADFHLKSRKARWDPALGRWVRDAEFSPCIDAGDPGSDYSEEPWPDGDRVNMGAYGNTPEASNSRRLHLPELSWLGTAGYETDGVDPDQGTGGDTRFRFKVLYSDADGHAPRYVSLHLRRNGKAFWEFAMVRGVGGYTTGRVYRRPRKLPPGNYEHCFKARDRDGLATGEATEWTPGPIVGPRTSVALTSLSAVPTNAGTQITFSLSSAAQVQARILNIAGRPVKTLCRAKDCDVGTNTLLWNAQSDQGLPVPNGTYLVELTARATDGTQARAVVAMRGHP